MIATLLVCSLVIALASGLDSYYAVRTHLGWMDEFNPLAEYILKRWGLSALIGLKTAGTATAIALLWVMALWFPVAAAAAACFLAASMASLTVLLWLSS